MIVAVLVIRPEFFLVDLCRFRVGGGGGGEGGGGWRRKKSF